jgi:hypothetical protein
MNFQKGTWKNPLLLTNSNFEWIDRKAETIADACVVSLISDMSSLPESDILVCKCFSVPEILGMHRLCC